MACGSAAGFGALRLVAAARARARSSGDVADAVQGSDAALRASVRTDGSGHSIVKALRAVVPQTMAERGRHSEQL